MDMLKYVTIPTPIISYISNAYSPLRSFVSSLNWITDLFPIECGIFQSDTLSPMIFLIAFNPVVQFANKEKAVGFSLRYLSHLHVACSLSMPTSTLNGTGPHQTNLPDGIAAQSPSTPSLA